MAAGRRCSPSTPSSGGGSSTGFPLALELPTDRPRPAVQSQRGGLYRVRAGAERTDRLRALARQRGDDAVHGPPGGARRAPPPLLRAGEDRRRLEQRQPRAAGAGAGLRPLPHPGPVPGRPRRAIRPSASCSAACGGRRWRSYAHQSLPFSKLIEALGPEPDPRRDPVVQALLLVLEGQSSMRAGDLELPRGAAVRRQLALGPDVRPLRLPRRGALGAARVQHRHLRGRRPRDACSSCSTA